MAKAKTATLELDAAELDTLYIGLEQACDNTADDEDYEYFQKLMKKVEKAQKRLTAEQ